MLFNRICKLVVGKPNEEVLVFDQNFRVTFNLSKSITSTSKHSAIQIYNLSKDTRDKLRDIIRRNYDLVQKGGEQLWVFLFAGYSEDVGLEFLYSANIMNIFSKKEPPDVITEIICADNALTYKNTFMSMSYNAGVSTKEILDNIAKELKMVISDSSNIPAHINLANGYSFNGTSKEGLNKIIKILNAHWTTENNEIRIQPIGGYTKDSVVVVSAKSGMIKSPERIESQGDDTDNEKAKHGWKVNMLLQPKLLPGRRVKIESEDVNGIFIIDSVEHSGDTMEGTWESTIETKEAQKNF